MNNSGGMSVGQGKIVTGKLWAEGKMANYQTLEILQRHRAKLLTSVVLDDGVQLASWFNQCDRVTNLSDHHTLSLYTQEGYDTWHKTPHGWRNGGAPDRFCLMPSQTESTWDVRAQLYFSHLYCTPQHLTTLAEKIWDRGGAQVSPDEKVFGNDPRISQIYRQFLLNCDWQQPANHLMLSSASTLLLTCLVQDYSNVRWALPQVRGGLAPTVLRRVYDYIEQHLSEPLTLSDLAAQAALSEYHFARMFRHSSGHSPHQFVMARRMQKAVSLLRHSQIPLTAIAEECGFSSLSHFSRRFRQQYGHTPSAVREGTFR